MSVEQEQMHEKAKGVFDEVLETLDYLEMRWQDEAAYEDWNEYEEAIRKEVEESGAEFVSLSGGFDLRFRVDGRLYEVTLTEDGLGLFELEKKGQE